jgi:hypothetical protein
MIGVSTIETLSEGSVRIVLFDHTENRIGIVDAYAVRWYDTPRRRRGAAKKTEDEPEQASLMDESDVPKAAETTDSEDEVPLTSGMFEERA